MDLRTVGKSVLAGLSKRSPAILTTLGIFGFGTTCVMVAKAAPRASEEHLRHKMDREEAKELSSCEEEYKEIVISSVKREAVDMAKLYGPAAAVGLASVGCFIGANKIHLDRQAAVMAAYSLSAETLSRYQDKVIEKLGEEEHAILMGETAKEVADSHPEPGYDHASQVIPAGTVRVFDTVTGRYFFASRESILEAESEVNKRLVNECRVPLQEFYYAMGIEERFNLGEILCWDVSGYSCGDCLNVMIGPHLDDDKNPCLAISYHVSVLSQRGV